MGKISLAKCAYCGAAILRPSQKYCCAGCRVVDQILQSENQSAQNWGLRPRQESDPSLADPVALARFVSEDPQGPFSRLFFEGIQCSGCLTVLARLPEYIPQVRDVRWNNVDSVLTVNWGAAADLVTLSQTLSRLGFTFRWLEHDHPANQFRQSLRRQELQRIAVVGALFANIMLFAISVYAGAPAGLKQIFDWISFVLFIPVMSYGAWPFYRNAIRAFRSRVFNVDLPLTLAFLAGSIFSIYSLVKHQGSATGDIYFDSLSGFLFLILTTRYFLKSSQWAASDPYPLEFFFDRPLFQVNSPPTRTAEAPTEPPRAAELVQPPTWSAEAPKAPTWPEPRWTSLTQLKVGDLVTVPAGARVPVDGTLRSVSTELDLAFLTGESSPRLVTKGESVLAGSRVIGQAIEVQAEKVGFATEVGKIIDSINQKSLTLEIGHVTGGKVGSGLLLLVLAVAGITFLLLFQSQPAEGFRRIMALFIVACPCAIAFGAPLTYARSIKEAFRQGLVVRRSETFSALKRVRAVAFDKTGTLTKGQLRLFLLHPVLDRYLKQIILTLEQHSRHPVAEALKRQWGPLPPLEVVDLREVPGQGVEGRFGGDQYSLRTAQETSPTAGPGIELFRNGQSMLRLSFEDEVRPESAPLVQELHRRKIETWIFSGDQTEKVRELAQLLAIPEDHAFGRLSPQGKRAQLEKVKPDLYVGDGVNDVPALHSVRVSMAMPGSSLEAQLASDVLILRGGLERILDLLTIATKARRTLRRNLTIALTYNIAAGLAAVMGWVGPLGAAILMPLSSLAIYLSTEWI
ncbi:MAG: hypothetical protein C5B49_05610 [Bdellovibrio sp.]|nr:MAG: hypothetical protein C5B49_05610 [Bdellovibrio sp.]